MLIFASSSPFICSRSQVESKLVKRLPEVETNCEEVEVLPLTDTLWFLVSHLAIHLILLVGLGFLCCVSVVHGQGATRGMVYVTWFY